MGSLRLFIKAVRYSRTIADERLVIRKESAAIRTAFKDVNLSNNKRRVNIQKLLYLYILGEKTHFGQIECIKLLASTNFVDKRLGYLAASLLLDENQEILTLLTNSLVQDLMHPNQYFVALALSTLATVLSYDLSNDTYQSVLQIMTKNELNPYLKKKAILVAAKIVEKNGDLIELFYETFLKRRVLSVEERDHLVLLAVCELVKSFYKHGNGLIKVSLVLNSLPKLLAILKNLSATNYYPEYDIMGVPDPFLHVLLLQAVTQIITLPVASAEEALAENSAELAQYGIPRNVNLARSFGQLNDQYNDLLTQISLNVEFGKNAGNLILYEVVRLIFSLKNSNSALKVLGINLLGRFLTLSDNNIRYISLNTLLTVVELEPKTVQRHQTIILSCLFDRDISIKRRALELVFEILNGNNIRVLVKELVRFLQTDADSGSGFNEFNMFSYNLAKDPDDYSLSGSGNTSKALGQGNLDNGASYSLNNLDLKYFITSKLTLLLRSYSPSLAFFFKYLIILLDLNGNYLTNDILLFILSIIANIANNKPVDIGEGPFNAADTQKLVADSLAQIHSLALKKPTNIGLNLVNVWCLGEYGELYGPDVLEYLTKLSKLSAGPLLHLYVLTCALKLLKTYSNDISALALLEQIVRSYTNSVNVGLQTKALEYLAIMTMKDESFKRGLLERVPPPQVREFGTVSLSTKEEAPKKAGNTESFLLDLMDEGDKKEAPAQSSADLLLDIFGSSGDTTTPSTSSVPKKSEGKEILDLFGSASASSSGVSNSFLVDAKYKQIFSNEDITVKLSEASIQPGNAVLEIYILSNGTAIKDFNLLIAVAKSQKLVIVPSEGITEITSSNFYKQELRITGRQGLKLKLRVKFTYGGKDVLFDHNLGKEL